MPRSWQAAVLHWAVNGTYIYQETNELFVQNLAEMVYTVWKHLKVCVICGISFNRI